MGGTGRNGRCECAFRDCRCGDRGSMGMARIHGPDAPVVPSDPRHIYEDLAQLKQITDCVRTYSIDHGLDQIPEIAKRHGMKVLQGLWVSNQPDTTRQQGETA